MINQGLVPEQVVQFPSWPHAQLQELGHSIWVVWDGAIHLDHCMVLTTPAKFAPRHGDSILGVISVPLGLACHLAQLLPFLCKKEGWGARAREGARGREAEDSESGRREYVQIKIHAAISMDVHGS